MLLKEFAFLPLAVGCSAVFLAILLQSEGKKGGDEKLDVVKMMWIDRMFSSLFHSFGSIAVVAKNPRLDRDRDKVFIHSTALVWLTVDSISLLVVVGLYEGGAWLPHWPDTRIITLDIFHPLVGVVLAMGPIHYGLLCYQVLTQTKFSLSQVLLFRFWVSTGRRRLAR